MVSILSYSLAIPSNGLSLLELTNLASGSVCCQLMSHSVLQAMTDFSRENRPKLNFSYIVSEDIYDNVHEIPGIKFSVRNQPLRLHKHKAGLLGHLDRVQWRIIAVPPQ